MDPISRSAKPFCQGEAGVVGLRWALGRKHLLRELECVAITAGDEDSAAALLFFGGSGGGRSDRPPSHLPPYQSPQLRRNAFDVGGLVASFVVTKTGDTVFVGLYKTVARRNALPNEQAPVLDIPLKPTDIVHDMHLDKPMADYIGRLVIEPWKDAINFVRRASRDPSPSVKEIKRSPYEEPFPGLVGFSRRVEELPGLFPIYGNRALRLHAQHGWCRREAVLGSGCPRQAVAPDCR